MEHSVFVPPPILPTRTPVGVGDAVAAYRDINRELGSILTGPTIRVVSTAIGTRYQDSIPARSGVPYVLGMVVSVTATAADGGTHVSTIGTSFVLPFGDG